MLSEAISSQELTNKCTNLSLNTISWIRDTEKKNSSFFELRIRSLKSQDSEQKSYYSEK